MPTQRSLLLTNTRAVKRLASGQLCLTQCTAVVTMRVSIAKETRAMRSSNGNLDNEQAKT